MGPDWPLNQLGGGGGGGLNPGGKSKGNASCGDIAFVLNRM